MTFNLRKAKTANAQLLCLVMMVWKGRLFHSH